MSDYLILVRFFVCSDLQSLSSLCLTILSKRLVATTTHRQCSCKKLALLRLVEGYSRFVRLRTCGCSASKFWIVTSLNRVPDCHKCLGGQTYYFALKARKDITYLLSTHNESTTFNWGRVKNKTLRCVCSRSCSSYSCFSDIRLISTQRTCSVRGTHLMLFRNYLLWHRDVPSLCFERYLAWNRSCPIGRRYSRGSECHCLVHYASTILQIRMSTPHHSYFL